MTQRAPFVPAVAHVPAHPHLQPLRPTVTPRTFGPETPPKTTCFGLEPTLTLEPGRRVNYLCYFQWRAVTGHRGNRRSSSRAPGILKAALCFWLGYHGELRRRNRHALYITPCPFSLKVPEPKKANSQRQPVARFGIRKEGLYPGFPKVRGYRPVDL